MLLCDRLCYNIDILTFRKEVTTVKNINVVAAIIKDKDKIFITKRSYGEFINMWEFPGGKIEPNESKEDALIREIKEELELDIKISSFLTTVEYDYPNFHLTMHCYICHINGGVLHLNAHNDSKWSNINDLKNVTWVPADLLVIEELKRLN